METRDLIIIGAGPAGLSAAVTAAKAGVKVTIIGEDPQIGGQIFRQPIPPLEFRSPLIDIQDKKIFTRLKRGLQDAKVEFLSNTLGWGLSDDKIIFYNRQKSSGIKARFLLIAEGAYEAPVPFPGWTLPGVMTLGGLQNLVKSQGIVPSGKIVIAGTGPLLFYTASQLIKNGAEVSALLEASSLSKWFQWTSRLVRAPGVLMKGINYYRILSGRKVPVYYSSLVSSVSGNKRLEEVVFTKADQNWTPIPFSEKKISADYLCMNFGFIPSTQFTHLAGCEHKYDPDLRGWIPKHDSSLETTQENIYVAGDGNGIGGVKTAVLEGELVGTWVAVRLGCIDVGEAEGQIKRLHRALRRRGWYSKFLRDIYRFRSGLNELLTDDTQICRCEEVTFKSLRDVFQKNPQDLARIRILTRLGMGMCQGRFCYPTLLGLLAKNRQPEEMASFDYRARPPLKPLSIKELINLKTLD